MSDYHKPEKEMIQIKPGVWIEVSKRMKRASGLGKGVRIINRLEQEERKRILGQSMKRFKYSPLMLDEAARLAARVGIRQAAQATGVKFWSIVQWQRKLRLEGKLPKGKPNPGNARYTLAQKQQCVRLAMRIADREQRGMTRALREAGRRLGMNGVSINEQWSRGAIPL